MIEPVGDSAAILFNVEEVVQIKAKIRKYASTPERYKFVAKILDGFLGGETPTETSKRMGISQGLVVSAHRTIGCALTGLSERKFRSSLN